MRWLWQGLTTSVGTKFLMALTGMFLFLFTVAHMVGNLQVFAGPDQLNAYAAGLKKLGPILWVMRLGLLATFVAHILCAFSLVKRNEEARPVQYAVMRPIAATYASRTMIMSGLIVLAFVVYHLAHFTLGWTHGDHFALRDARDRHDVYRMVVLGFQSPFVALSYVVAMVFLGLHLSHGAASLFQSMGWNRKKYSCFFAGAARGLAMLVVLGNLAMPLSILFRLVGQEVTP